MPFLKIVITGSNGLLGQKLVKMLGHSEGVKLYALSRGENRLHLKTGYTYINVDLTDESRMRQVLEEVRPDFLVHTAAMTNVDACELDKAECDRMNVDMISQMLPVLKGIGTHLIHLSTDFVFSGRKGSLYTEQDPPDPVNYYGLSKLRSEELVEASGVPAAILRTVLVYGLVDGNDRSNVVLWVKNSLEQGKEIRVVTDQLRMPTYAEDLAEACWLAIRERATGIFNVSSSELFSIYELAILVAEAFGLDKSLIHPVETSELSLAAQRPLSTGLDLSKSARVLKLPLRSFRNRLQDFKDQLLSETSDND